MKLLKSTHDKINESNYRYKCLLSNNLESYEKIFHSLKKCGSSIIIQIFINDDLSTKVNLTSDKFLYKIFCNTRIEKRSIEKFVEKKLTWIDIKK